MRSDLLWESMVRLLRRNPLWLPALLFWFLQGRAHLKAQIARRVTVDAAALPYQEDLLEFLRSEARSGRRLVLATASDEALALPVAKHVGLFAETLASNGKLNLRGSNKVKVLAQRYGERGFDYAGNSSVDLPVWAGSRQSVVINASPRLLRRAKAVSQVSAVFGEAPARPGQFLRALRLENWWKNLLAFGPLLACSGVALQSAAASIALASVGLCLCTGAMELLRGLLDLDTDRADSTKRGLPFASGRLPLSWGLSGMPLLLLVATVVCGALPAVVLALLAAFVVVAICRLGWGRRFPVADIALLASLDLLRVMTGYAAAGFTASTGWIAIWAAVSLGLAIVSRSAWQAKSRGA